MIEERDRAGPLLAGLGLAIIVGLLALTRQGGPYMLLADIVFGFIAAGLFLLSLFQSKR